MLNGNKKTGEAETVLYLKIAIALTFSAHGLYAIGYYPQPGVFVDMLINILHFSETTAKDFLFVLCLGGLIVRGDVALTRFLGSLV